jgi:hypothetical protein
MTISASRIPRYMHSPLLPCRHTSHRVKLVEHRLARVDDASVRISREWAFEPGFIRCLRQQGAKLDKLDLKMKLPARN